MFYFGNLIFLFGGDIENLTIQQFQGRTIPASLDFLKIPHHGSKSSTSLFEFVESIDVSCVTAYMRGSSQNPDLCVMKRYKEISNQIYATQNQNNNNDDFGVVYTVFDIINQSHKTVLQGNACEYVCI